MHHSFDRRGFLRFALASAATASLGPLAVTTASAAEKLSPSDPTAAALGYVEDAETTKDAAHKKGLKCQTCALYMAAQAADGHAPCGAFGGKLVAAAGWCKAYSPAG